jgi:hypothetical protein
VLSTPDFATSSLLPLLLAVVCEPKTCIALNEQLIVGPNFILCPFTVSGAISLPASAPLAIASQPGESAGVEPIRATSANFGVCGTCDLPATCRRFSVRRNSEVRNLISSHVTSSRHTEPLCMRHATTGKSQEGTKPTKHQAQLQAPPRHQGTKLESRALSFIHSFTSHTSSLHTGRPPITHRIAVNHFTQVRTLRSLASIQVF